MDGVSTIGVGTSFCVLVVLFSIAYDHQHALESVGYVWLMKSHTKQTLKTNSDDVKELVQLVWDSEAASVAMTGR